MDNTQHTCWYIDLKCNNCNTQLATNGKDYWCECKHSLTIGGKEE